MGQDLLTPTRIYVDEIAALQKAFRAEQKIILASPTSPGRPRRERAPRPAARTQGGLPQGCLEAPGLFAEVQRRGRIPDSEMWRTFNMGIGMAIVIRPTAWNWPRKSARGAPRRRDRRGQARSGDRLSMKIAVFASGEGTNLQALLDACATGACAARWRSSSRTRPRPAPCAAPAAPGRSAGRAARVLPVAGRVQTPSSPTSAKKRGIGLVCLAGFMLKIKPPLLKAFPGRVLNIHPSLLPRLRGRGMYGRRVHENALAAGVKVSGATVHVVDEEYDRGPIVLQASVPVLSSDTPRPWPPACATRSTTSIQAVALFCDNGEGDGA